MYCTNDTAGSWNSTEDLALPVSRAAILVRDVIKEVVMPCACGLGIVGNLLSLMVLTTEKLHRTLNKMETSAHIGLIALAVSDFLFCLLALVSTQVPREKKFYEIGDHMIYFHQLVNGLITVFIVSSTLLIVVMAAERYIAVCHPLRARNLISLRRTRTSITLVFVVCAIATIPIFFEQGIEEMLCDDGRTVLHLVDRQWMKKRRIIWAILFDFIPCVALVYFNLCLIIQIRRAKKLRDEMTPKHSIIRYNSQGLKSTSLRTNPPHLTTFNKKTNGLYVKRSRVKRQPTEPSYILETPDSQCPENGVEVKKYSKLNALGRGDNLKLTEPPSRSLCSESTDNEFQALNDVPKTAPRQGQTGNAVKLRNIETNVGRKRPSDSALNSVTATLVAVVLLFLILVSPSELLKFSMEYTNASHAQMGVVKAVTNFMQVLNFSLNFVLYCAVNKTFRHTLHGLICCCWLSVRG